LNFFGHYYIDGIKANPFYNFGLVYPDLFRDLLREKALKKTIAPESSDLLQLNAGITQHINRDKWFHHTSVFVNGDQFMKDEFAKSGLDLLIPRSWFLAHVFFELALDRQLVIHYPERVDAFYDDLEIIKLEINKTVDWFCNYGQFEKMSERLKRISQDKYIFAYTNNEMLISALWRVYKQAGLSTELLKTEQINMELSNILTLSDKSELFHPQLLDKHI
jgi:hypothetical protein